MAIYVENNDQVFTELQEVKNGTTHCFLCGEIIGKTAIFWSGYGPQFIFFHPTCAISFIRRISEDCERYFISNPNTPLCKYPKNG